MPHFIYNVLLYLILPLVPLKLLWRSFKQPAYLKYWGERFGQYKTPTSKPIIWLHCVSVGETRAAAPLVERLQQEHPQYQILITNGTPTGRDTSKQLFGDTVLRAYLPYDLPFAVNGFIQHFKPALGILMETELWFNLIDSCNESAVPLLLLNARMSEKSAERYAKLGKLIENGLQSLKLVAAQSFEDEARFKQLGADNTIVSGNFKFDVTPPAEQIAAGLALRELLNTDKPIFVAASTREGEEEIILDAVKNLDILTIIVPRHPQRFDEVEVLLTTSNIDHQLKTDIKGKVDSHIKVILGNTMGELFSYYAACDFAFVGGSLMKYGGQNIIEPAALGKPILIGKYTYNFAEATKSAVKMGAATQVKSVEDFKLKLDALAIKPHLRKEVGDAAMQFSQAHTGATKRVMKEVAKYLNH